MRETKTKLYEKKEKERRQKNIEKKNYAKRVSCKLLASESTWSNDILQTNSGYRFQI